jgi:hypothetical protein
MLLAFDGRRLTRPNKLTRGLIYFQVFCMTEAKNPSFFSFFEVVKTKPLCL